MNKYLLKPFVALLLFASVTSHGTVTREIDLASGEAVSGQWTYSDGVLTGRAQPGETAWYRLDVDTKPYVNGEQLRVINMLWLDFRTPQPANGGIVTHGHELPANPSAGAEPRTVYGYQVNIETRVAEATGAIIEEGRRGMLVRCAPDAQKTLKPTDWNTLGVQTSGASITTTLNQQPAAKLFDEAYIAGGIYLQVAGSESGVAEVQYRGANVGVSALPEQWRPLFDGASLDGWKEWGSEEWSVADGVIQGRRGPKESEGYLATEETWRDFRVRGAFKMLGEGNYGLFYHSTITLRDDGYPVIAGVQGEVEPNYPGDTGGLYESYQRGWIARPGENSLAAYALKPGEWNTIEIRSRGNHVTTWVNGFRTVDFIDPEPRLFSGSFALQLHTGAGAGIDWKDLYVLDE